ncbi:MAG: hypothetical protein ABI569_12225 [Casimicrobiaceae bacterium]
MMRSIWSVALLAGTALCLLQAPAQASTCYFVFDRSDAVVYRDAQPPVDMSVRGVAARDAMRQRGEYLLFVDTDRCAPLAFITGPGTPGTLSVDQIVAGYPTLATSNPVSGGSSGGGSVGSTASRSAAPKAAPAAKSSSSANYKK